MVANLNPTVLATLLNPELDAGSTVVAVDAQHQLIYDTAMGKVADDTALLAAGALSTTVDNAATRQAASTGQPGTARFTDLHGHDVIGGYDVVDGLHWTILAQDPASTVLAPVTSQRHRAILIVALGALLAIGAAVWFAWRTTRPLRRLTAGLGHGGRRGPQRAGRARGVERAGHAGRVVQRHARHVPDADRADGDCGGGGEFGGGGVVGVLG